MEIEHKSNRSSFEEQKKNSINIKLTHILLGSEYKRKRRSKNDQEGRLFRCECGRSYLSALALSNHKKSKHEKNEKEDYLENSFESRKKRGRPKKNSEYQLAYFNNPELFFNLFFQKDNRKIKYEKNYDIKECINYVINEISYELNLDLHNNNFISIIVNNSKAQGIKGHLNCDQIFLKYLEEMQHNTNKEYFIFIFKFIILFRECINKYKNVELENSISVLGEAIPKHIKEFTQYYDAEQTPELCNEFLTDFLENNIFLSEYIDVTQHFCYWLYQNNYTSSRLSLVN